jgi:hypothetical protein
MQHDNLREANWLLGPAGFFFRYSLSFVAENYKTITNFPKGDVSPAMPNANQPR